jgi:putative hydrolase of the HAD superfamily
MVIIFDLDDTLYVEEAFVQGGFCRVAEYVEDVWGFSSVIVLRELNCIYSRQGRGKVFDTWLASKGILSQKASKKLVSIYRSHDPKIALLPGASRILTELGEEHSLYVVTDGNKLVQARKVEALGLAERVNGVYITHRFGLAASKPSVHCFDLIRRREGCEWKEMLYVGDNPHKDFVGIKPLGVHTVRVLTGPYKDLYLSQEAEAGQAIPILDDLGEIVRSLSRGLSTPRSSQ